MRTTSNHAALVAVPGGLAFTSTYDPGLVNAFKTAIPSTARRWDGVNKRWIVDAQYGPQIAKLVDAYLGVTISVPQAVAVPITETRLIKLEYLGACKERNPGESSAFGYADGGWTVVIAEVILREWFEAIPQRPDEQPTLYATLAVKATASSNEIRSAYRRLALQWHPDTCREVGAAETFKTINHAYQVLSNEMMRRKYDAGLALQASLKKPSGGRDLAYSASFAAVTASYGYRSPLRCGWILAEGQEVLGRFNVSKLCQWEDITNSEGQTMIVSWPAGAKEFEVNWR